MYTKFEEDVSVHQSLPDEPNVDNGISTEELKKLWDKPAELLKEAFNKLIVEMTSKDSAKNQGATQLEESDNSESNVQAKLIYLMNAIKNVSQGQIPDGTITASKIDPSYEALLAKKDGILQANLNSEFLNGYSADKLQERAIKTGEFTWSSAVKIELGFKPRILFVYFNGSRNGNIVGYGPGKGIMTSVSSIGSTTYNTGKVFSLTMDDTSFSLEDAKTFFDSSTSVSMNCDYVAFR